MNDSIHNDEYDLSAYEINPKDNFRAAVLSGIHDEGLSVGDAVDASYEALIEKRNQNDQSIER